MVNQRQSREFTLAAVACIAVVLACTANARSNDTAAAPTSQEDGLWSLRPIADPELPRVQRGEWARVPLDFFVLAGLESHDLQPVAEADRGTWLRRVSFDLTGLPPTPREIETFLSDPSPQAFENVVDRLLASPHFGERWARHWMDVARYGEDQAHSFQPRLYPEGYRYRDWLIGAFNEDLPYDEFLATQIAGDLMEQPGRKERLPALGFFALGPVYYGGNKQKEMDELEDRVDTFARGMLGLTVACARCHDHKFDPVSQEDFYALAGIFASSKYVEVPLAPPEIVERYEQAQQEIQSLEKEIETVRKEIKDDSDKDSSDHQQREEQLKELRKKLEELRDQAPPKYAFCHAWQDADEPHDLPLLERGNVDSPGETVHRRFLEILSGSEATPFTQGSGRLQLARAVASSDNPLTARVLVNRVWQRLFGRGIVVSPSNFGALGGEPSHPRLLDHLASRMIENGWSIKWLCRTIVLSATYRLSSQFDAKNYEIDSGNQWLWRMNRRRLDVEAWRDAMLSVSGQLDTQVGGPSIDLADEENRRRTLYAKISRHDLSSLLRLFDFPDPNVTSDERSVTTVPLQQLFVLNSEFLVRQAKALAARLTAEASEGEAARIERAFALAYGRPALQREIELGVGFLEQAQGDSPGGAGHDMTPWEQYAQILLSANEFMYLD